jgi:lipopolysaccharide transport system ATP-binding protein
LFVSHDLALVKQLSDRAILLLNGRIEAEGAPKDVINRYIGLVLEKQSAERDTSSHRQLKPGYRHGDGASEILDVQLVDSENAKRTAFRSGERTTVRVRCVFHREQCDPMVGILIRNRIGMEVYGTNTRLEQVDLGCFQAGEILDVDFQFECWLAPQQYTLTVATQNPDGSSHDWLDDVLAFEVVDPRALAGVANLQARVEWRVSR